MKFKIKQITGSWYFLIAIFLIYFFLFLFSRENFLSAGSFSFGIIQKIILVFVLVFILMSITNYFFTPKFVSKHFQKKGFSKWFFAVAGGILSTGPIYLWYPLLADLKSKGFNYGLISCFLYNRAIKIPLVPIMIFYFSLKYVIVLSLVMIFASVFQGILVNKFMEVKK